MVKKAASLITILMIISTSTLACAIDEKSTTQNQISPNNQYDKGFRYNIQGWVYIHIEGEPYERGFQYGYLASQEIVDMIKRCANFGHGIKFMKLFPIKNLPKNYDKLSKQWWDICKSRAFEKYWKNYPDELKQEIMGIADGVNAKTNEKINGEPMSYKDILGLNEFQNVWWSIKNKANSLHPLRGLFQGIKNLLDISTNSVEPLHCSAFIATGDATADGGIVVGHSTHFNPYIAERCNIILDVEPINGYRFMMTCFPGTIWSNEDYYQNDQGMVLVETALPQGPFKKNGLTIGIRARNAIQYSNSIDDVIKYLKEGNNGLIPDEWLIGDIKTNEIASIELALYNTPIRRTFNGFYWSCNVPHDKKVRREVYGIIDLIPFISNKYYDAFSYGRDEKFIELKEKNYGKIDTEIAKEILATFPICKDMTDGKVTSSSLLKDMRLLTCMGNPNGIQFNPTDSDKEKFHGFTELPSSGWVEIYPLVSEKNTRDLSQLELDCTKNINDITSTYTIDNKIIYFGLLDGYIYAFDSVTKNIKWKYETGWSIVTKPTVSGDLVYVGSLDNNFYALEKNNGKVRWEYNCKAAIHSSAVVYGEYVFFGSDDGRLYALNKTNGELAWYFAPKYTIKDDDINNYITTPILSTPIVKDGMVHIEIEGVIYSLDAQTIEKPQEKVKEIDDSENGLLFFLFFLIIISMIILVYLITKRRNKL